MTSSSSACGSTPTATATSPSAWREATAGAASSTPAGAPPAAASSASCRPTSPRTPTIEILEGARAASLVTADGTATGVRLEDGRTLQARGTLLATGGAAALWSRTTNPPGSFGSGLLLARAAGAALADLEFVQFHPTAVVGVEGREGFLITEAIRGEGATLHDAHGERFIDELAPRDAVARAIHKTLQEQQIPAVQPRHAADRPRALPERRRRAQRRRAGPGQGARPRRPREPLRDGRDRHRPRRAVGGRGPVRGRRVRLHRPARRQPAGVQLAVGVLRLRPSRRPARARSSPRATLHADPAPAEPVSPAPTRETRKAMWRHAGLERDAAGLHRCSTIRTRSRGSSRTPRCSARNPAARTLAPTSRSSIRPSTSATRCVENGAPELVYWQ